MSAPELSPLGKAVNYADHYDPTLLFPIDRRDKRREIGLLEGAPLPFVGEDLWNAYELSWLNPRGKPMVALGEFRVPADSPCLIESKSLKLYLNSFNQTTMASAEAVSESITRDLSVAAGSHVNVALRSLGEAQIRPIEHPAGTLLDALDIDIADYEGPNPSLLCTDTTAPVRDETLFSHLLKSNCLVTGQPDWGMIVVRYRGHPIDPAGMLRYIVSFRRHNEFHEQCVERVFVDVMRQCAPEQLEVWARYTRRGGLDINPWRSNQRHVKPPPNFFEGRQ